MVTIKDVARESGVAISTVSNVLNHVDVVSEQTRKKVLAAAEKLKYVPNVNAKYLKSGKKNTLGLFLASIQGDFYRSLIQAIHLQCKLAGYMLNIYVSNENTAEEIYGMVIASGVEGAIIINESLTDEYIERISLTHMPIVFCDRTYVSENMSSVTINNYDGAVQAVEYLVKQGHRNIGYMHGTISRDDEIRYQAYVDVMNKYHLPIDPKTVLRGYFEENVAYSETTKLIYQAAKLPDAFFCANDEMAWGCIRALASLGIKVPDRISVIGFDDSTLAAHYVPTLTTVHNPVIDLGSTSALELIRLVRKEGEPSGKSIQLNPALIVRDSTGLRI